MAKKESPARQYIGKHPDSRGVVLWQRVQRDGVDPHPRGGGFDTPVSIEVAQAALERRKEQQRLELRWALQKRRGKKRKDKKGKNKHPKGLRVCGQVLKGDGFFFIL